MIRFIASLFTHKFELVQEMCKLVQRMMQTNQIIATLFSNKFKLFKTCIIGVSPSLVSRWHEKASFLSS